MKRVIILITGLSIFTAHLLATFLYLAPVNPVTAEYKPVINAYMSPLFSQNWGLFAPAPATASLKLFYRCEGEKWSSWYDVLTPLYQTHHTLPFTYRGKITYIYQTLTRDLFNDSLKHKNLFKNEGTNSLLDMPASISQERTFNDLAYAVNDLCRAQNQKVKAFQFQIVRSYVPDFSKRFIEKIGRQEFVFYPKVELYTKKKTYAENL